MKQAQVFLHQKVDKLIHENLLQHRHSHKCIINKDYAGNSEALKNVYFYAIRALLLISTSIPSCILNLPHQLQ